MSYEDLADKMEQAIADLEASHGELEQSTRDWAEAERRYKLAGAKALLVVKGETVGEREAKAEETVVDGSTVNVLRYDAHLKDGIKASALEAVRSRRTVLSAYQTLANLSREEASFARTGP